MAVGFLETLRMETLCTGAIGMFKDPEKSVGKWKLAHKWPISQVKRVGIMCTRCELPLCYNHNKMYRNQKNRSSGFSMVLNTCLLCRDHYCNSIFAGGEDHLARWVQGRIRQGIYPSVTALKTFVYEKDISLVVSQDGQEKDAEDKSVNSMEEAGFGYIVQETLNLLEWPAVCDQVAQFACTPMGISIAREANLTIGADRLQSEELLQQTAAAYALPRALQFTGIEDLQSLVVEAVSGTVCQIQELCRVKATLIGIQSVYDQLCGPGSSSTHSEDCISLQALMSDSDLCSDLVDEIDHCLDCTLSTVLDRASPALAAARLSRQDNMRALETLLKETAARIIQQGGMDSLIITRRRTRLCIAVRSSHKSLLPGGVTLDVSNTGTTSFIEPEPALSLNNENMRLAGMEKAEEMAVLKKLTYKLVEKADMIMDLLGRVTMVDLACARASHARWLGSVCPSFYDEQGLMTSLRKLDELSAGHSELSCKESTQGLGHNNSMFDIEGMRHPLLLGPVLPTLPPSQRHGTVQSATSPGSSPRKPNLLKSPVVSETMKLPVPVDIKVHSKVRVVTITGPNTGGKTATLKTFGLAVVMSKAGLFLPAVGKPMLPWFDMVLADVGDDQSLERSLSTFSGHIRRLCSIWEVATHQSFVLLDEIGSGTDPVEGAALATAVLQHLSSQVRLTIATTHSAELKTLKDQDPRFENASVEFDGKTLQPTYRVLWGVAGQSNALNIAESLGFDNVVVARAREMVGKLLPSQLGVRTTELLGPLLKQRNELLERSRRAANVLSKAQQLHCELKEAADNLPKREAEWRRLEEQAVESDISSAKLRMDEVIERFKEALEEVKTEDSQSFIREALAEIASIVEEFTIKQGRTTFQDLFPRDRGKGSLDYTFGAEQLAVGQKVQVRRLGKTPVTVIQLPQKDKDYLTVQAGTLKLQVKSSEVLRIIPGSASTPTSTQKMLYKTSNRVRSQRDDPTISEPKYEVAVQTSKNTLDLRGMRVDDAMRELNLAIAGRSALSVLFVIHGIGTGAVKEGVYQTLQKHPRVAKFGEESIANAGCTIVYIK